MTVPDLMLCKGCQTYQHPFLNCPKCGTPSHLWKTGAQGKPTTRKSPQNRAKWQEYNKKRKMEADERHTRIMEWVEGNLEDNGRLQMSAHEIAMAVSETVEEVGTDIILACLRENGWTYNASCKWWMR